MSYLNALAKLILATVLVGFLGALFIAPVAGLGGFAVAKTSEVMQSDVKDLEDSQAPGVTVIKDATGQDMAYLFEQRRHPVKSKEISQYMKDAIVSIEDRRFYEHDGVDIQGNLRAVVTNLLQGGVAQGASTLDQQYVKNYLLLVNADTKEEQQAATEQSLGRKLREVRAATQIDRTLTKDEILTNYLNLVPFGNHAYGIEAAARTYFGISAAELSLPQSAMLAGMVQSSEYFNPYTNHDEVLQRRNLVLDSMLSNGYISQEDHDWARVTDLDVLERPATLDNGCIIAGDRGFFCDYVVKYLEGKGLDLKELRRGGYTINTTLDPVVQDEAKAAVVANVNPQEPGVAEVMSVIKPGKDDRPVLAMVSSRAYGLDLEQFQTILPQPYSQVGHGAGSVFKIFTAAAAIEEGYGIKNRLPVPARYEASGLGHGGAANCPPDKYCVENAGVYATSMTLQDALAHSPNTAFVALLEQVGVKPTVDMAVKLGLRSYLDPGSFDKDHSIAQFAKDSNMGSFTLGPTAVNPLELSNVGASIAAGGRWCEPSPISSVIDRYGNEVYLKVPDCEDVMDLRAADALSNALQKDAVSGTAADSARAVGFDLPIAAKTGTTENHQSSAFIGFNSAMAAAPYIYNDGTTISPLCTAPVRQCPGGNLFGGNEPARTFLGMATNSELFRSGQTPPYAPIYNEGTTGSPLLDGLRGMQEDKAREKLEDEKYKVEVKTVSNSGARQGTVVRVLKPISGLKEGATVVLQVSDGTGYTPPPPAPRRNTYETYDGTAGDDSFESFQRDIEDLANGLRQQFGF